VREGRRPREFENRGLRRIFGPKRDEVKGNKEFQYLVISYNEKLKEITT
jgi:hypothetical protein